MQQPPNHSLQHHIRVLQDFIHRPMNRILANINKVLEPLREIMKEEVYARFLEKLEEPETVTDPDGNEKLTGLDYSDVALALTQYRGAMTRFAADRLM